MPKVNFYIDSEYLLQSLRRLRGKPKDTWLKKYDFKWDAFVEFLLDGRSIGTVYYYTARLDSEENPETFAEQTEYLKRIEDSLSNYNIKLRLAKMIKVKPKTKATWNENSDAYKKENKDYTWQQKGVDTRIVLDMGLSVYESDNDIAVLVSGDDDFEEVISYIRRHGKKVELVSFNRYDSRPPNDLISVCDNNVILGYNDLVEKGLVSSGSNPGGSRRQK